MDTTTELGYQPGDLWSTLEILHTATQAEELSKWLSETNVSAETFVSGYPVFIETGVRHFLSQCRQSRDLELEEDYITRRALRQLPPLSDIPHASEVLNLYRNCEQIQSEIRRSSSPDPVELVSEVADVIEPLMEVRKEIGQDLDVIDVGVNPAQIRRDVVILTLYKAFQQTRNNGPVGYGPSNLISWLDTGPREDSVQGYAVTLQYLWSTVLDPDKYVEVGIPDFTQTDRYTARDTWELEQDEVARSEESPLSSYHTFVKEGVVDPLDSRYPDDLRSLPLEAGDLLDWRGGSIKKCLAPLITETETPSLDELEPAARVAYGLIWFEQAEWMGGGGFNGLPLIETVLRGLEATYRQFDEEVPIHVTRFNHPVEGGNLVSYALLQRVPERSFGDPSGWLIFNNIAADFEIEGEYKIKRVESLLTQALDIPVKRTTVEVERSEFVEFVAGRLSDDYLMRTKANARMMEGIEAGRGILVELLTAYVLTKRYPEAQIHWSDKQHGEEIDVWVEHGDCIRVVECKADLAAAGVDKTRQQLSRKVGRFGSSQVIKREVWTWKQASESAIGSLETQGITVNCVSECSELGDSDTDDLSMLFSEFLPEITDRHPLMPAPRFS